MEDAAERHHQFQQAGRFGLALPPKFPDPLYPVPSNQQISPYVHPGYIEKQHGITGYYAPVEPADNCNPVWHRSCDTEHVLEKRQCRPLVGPLVNTKKHWESVGTIESAPDSGVSIDKEELNLPPDARSRILQWMEHSEKETQQHAQQGNYKSSRTKQGYNTGLSGSMGHGSMHAQPNTQGILMAPALQLDSRSTIEEASRRLTHEKRSKSHKNR